MLRTKQQEHERELWKEKLEDEVNTCSIKEIRNGENSCFQHHKVTEIEDNTVQGYCRRMGKI